MGNYEHLARTRTNKDNNVFYLDIINIQRQHPELDWKR